MFLVSCCVENFWLSITLIICNENKYNPTVDFNKLTQFSTSCLMWLKQSNYTAFLTRFAWARNWIFQCVCLTSYWSIFSSVVGINMHLKVKQWFPRCSDIKKNVFLFVKTSLKPSGTYAFMTYYSMLIQHMLSIKSLVHQSSSSHAWIYLI